MPEETESAAAGLAASLAEFDTPATPDGSPPPDTDDFLASFDLLPKEEPAAPAEPAAPETPPEEVVPPVEGDDEDPYPEEPPAPDAKTKTWSNIRSDLKKTKADLRAERDNTAKALQERDARLAELEKQVAQLPELTEKAKFVEESERELAIARVEGTRDFKDTIIKPLDAIQKAAEAIASSNDIKLDDILDVLTETDPAKQEERLEEISAGLSSVNQLKLFRMAEDSRMLLAKRDEILGRAVEAKKELETLNQQRETAAQKERREAFEKAVDHTAGELKKRIPFEAIADGETVDGIFATLAEKARASDFDSASPATKAFASFAAVALPVAAKQLAHAQAEIKKLQARIAEGNASRPKVGDAPAPPKSAGNDDGEFMSQFSGILGLQQSRPITELVEV